jgi:hypothetical protein
MGEHSLLSASAAERWATCPASVLLGADFPNTSSEAADEGTAAHMVAEMCLRNNDNAEAYEGRRIEVGHRTFEVGQEMIDAVNTYIRLVDTLQGSDGTLLIEQRVNYATALGVEEEHAFGTSDSIILRGNHMYIVDLKYGANPRNLVYADGKQLKLYAAGALDQFDLDGEITGVTLVICQPRCNHIHEYTLSVLELLVEVEELSAPAKRALDIMEKGTYDAEADVVPSTKGCQWCQAKRTCHGYRDFVSETVGSEKVEADLDAMVDLDQMTSDLPEPPSPETLDLIDQWVKEQRSWAAERLLAGETLRHWKLVEGKEGNRAWADKEEAEQALKTFRLKVEEMYDLNLISPTTAEKLHKAGRIGKLQWAKAQKMIVRSAAKPVPASINSKKPAVTIAPAVDEMPDETLEDLDGIA